MKQRQRRKQFWWTWHSTLSTIWSKHYGWFDWGMGRIKHQHKDALK